MKKIRRINYRRRRRVTERMENVCTNCAGKGRVLLVFRCRTCKGTGWVR